jgi:DNA-binding NarL/FixJ family response regulator
MIRVLVVSTHPVVRAGLQSILTAAGEFEVAGAGSTGEAEEQIQTFGPEIILLDIANGQAEWPEPLGQAPFGLSTYGIIIINGPISSPEIRRYLESGVQGYLVWDASSDEIIEAVSAAHSGLTVLSQQAARSLTAPTPAIPSDAGQQLTARELEVLQLVAQGLPSKTIAARLNISENTVKFHITAILGKLGASSRTEAVSIAIRQGLVSI